MTERLGGRQIKRGCREFWSLIECCDEQKEDEATMLVCRDVVVILYDFVEVSLVLPRNSLCVLITIYMYTTFVAALLFHKVADPQTVLTMETVHLGGTDRGVKI